VKWSDDFATGIASIDEQHRMLFGMAEDYRSALDEGHGERVYDMLLDSLDAYARAHFSTEEACMIKHGCPAAAANAAAHEQFVVVLSGFQERYRRDGFDRAEARDLVDTLDRWLSNHIARIDLRIKPYVPSLPGLDL
jgi:hemerythrin